MLVKIIQKSYLTSLMLLQKNKCTQISETHLTESRLHLCRDLCLIL